VPSADKDTSLSRVDMADKQQMEAEGAECDRKELLNKHAVSEG
jgi:hypothetical protein